MKGSKITLAEDIIAGVMILILALIPTIETILRLVTGSGLVGSIAVLKHVVIWVAWMGGIASSREGRHLSLAVSKKPGTLLDRILADIRDIWGGALNFAFGTASLTFLFWALSPADKAGVVPLRLVLIILPIGFFSMALRSLKRPDLDKLKLLPISCLLGIILALPSLIKILGLLWVDMPLGIYDLEDSWYNLFSYLRWPLIILTIFLGIRGMPIYLMLGGTALLLFAGSWSPLETIPNEVYNLLTENMIPAIPLFTIAGFLFSESSSGQRLVRFFRAVLGWLPGGLAVVAVVACAFFTTFTGASGVTILALGGLLATVLMQSGHYGGDFSRGLITSSGSVGLLFPPALPIIMYGVTAQISIKDMFLGGVFPGMLLVLALSGMGVFRALTRKRERVPFEVPEAWASFKQAFGDLMLPVVILFFYFGGITTLVETAAIAAVYAIVLTAVKKELTLDLMKRVLSRGVPVIGGVLVILAMAKGLSYFIIDAQVPTMITAFFREQVGSRIVFLILLNLALLITGTLMDIYSAILVVAPLIIPLGQLYGIHPVQLGIIFLANLQLGYLTPPVGMNLFLASYTFEQPIGRVYKQVMPFLLVLLVMVLLITYVPWFSLALIR